MSVYAEIVRELRKNFAQVYIFGSRARGDALKNSDLDIIIVDPRFESTKYPDRVSTVLRSIQKYMKAYPVDIDVIPLTPKEFERLKKSRTNLVGYLFGKGEAVEARNRRLAKISSEGL